MKRISHKQSEKVPKGAKRSNHWSTVRKAHLKKHPACAVCEATTGHIEVHHIHPFHSHPELELDPSNLITLCENLKDGVSCHLLIGHLGSFKSFNPDVVMDSKKWREKIFTRPKNVKGAT